MVFGHCKWVHFIDLYIVDSLFFFELHRRPPRVGENMKWMFQEVFMIILIREAVPRYVINIQE